MDLWLLARLDDNMSIIFPISRMLLTKLNFVRVSREFRIIFISPINSMTTQHHFHMLHMHDKTSGGRQESV